MANPERNHHPVIAAATVLGIGALAVHEIKAFRANHENYSSPLEYAKDRFLDIAESLRGDDSAFSPKSILANAMQYVQRFSRKSQEVIFKTVLEDWSPITTVGPERGNDPADTDNPNTDRVTRPLISMYSINRENSYKQKHVTDFKIEPAMGIFSTEDRDAAESAAATAANAVDDHMFFGIAEAEGQEIVSRTLVAAVHDKNVGDASITRLFQTAEGQTYAACAVSGDGITVLIRRGVRIDGQHNHEIIASTVESGGQLATTTTKLQLGDMLINTLGNNTADLAVKEYTTGTVMTYIGETKL